MESTWPLPVKANHPYLPDLVTINHNQSPLPSIHPSQNPWNREGPRRPKQLVPWFEQDQNPGNSLRNRTSTELEHNSTSCTTNDKICRYILQLRRYGSERSHSRTNQRSRNERIGAGRGFGPRLSLNSGCSLIFFFFFFFVLLLYACTGT